MRAVLAIVLALGVAFTSFGSAAASTGNASVYVIHGIPGKDLGLDPSLPVDVKVAGGCALQGFKFGQVVGPLSLPAGTYAIEISVANPAAPCSNAAVIAANVPFAAGESATVIAHLANGGAPTASKFVNDVSRTRGNQARLAVRHAANAPAVDICLYQRGNYLGSLANLVTGDQEQVDVRRGKYEAGVFAAGTLTQVGGFIPVTLQPRTATFVHAVGSLANGTFTVIPLVINLR